MRKKKSLSGKQESYFLADNKFKVLPTKPPKTITGIHNQQVSVLCFTGAGQSCQNFLFSRCDGGASKESVWADIIIVLVPETTTGRNLSYQHK